MSVQKLKFHSLLEAQYFMLHYITLKKFYLLRMKILNTSLFFLSSFLFFDVPVGVIIQLNPDEISIGLG